MWHALAGVGRTIGSYSNLPSTLLSSLRALSLRPARDRGRGGVNKKLEKEKTNKPLWPRVSASHGCNGCEQVVHRDFVTGSGEPRARASTRHR